MTPPEQQKALDYVRRRGTESTLAEIRRRVAGTYSEVEALAESISFDAARQRPRPDAWSVQEVVDHLIESDRPAVRQLADLLAGVSVEHPIAASLQSPSPLEADWQVLLEGFREVHRQILDLLDKATDDLPLTATAPVQMVVKCATPDGRLEPVSWLERFDWKAFAILLHAHNREHIAQIQRILGIQG